MRRLRGDEGRACRIMAVKIQVVKRGAVAKPNKAGTPPPSNFDFLTHLKDVSRLKGAICGNPALQGGGRPTQDIPSGRRHLRTGCLLADVPWSRHQHVSQAPPFRRVPSYRRSGLVRSLPALKGEVTVKFAFQASYAFQASAVHLTQDT